MPAATDGRHLHLAAYVLVANPARARSERRRVRTGDDLTETIFKSETVDGLFSEHPVTGLGALLA